MILYISCFKLHYIFECQMTPKEKFDWIFSFLIEKW